MNHWACEDLVLKIGQLKKGQLQQQSGNLLLTVGVFIRKGHF